LAHKKKHKQHGMGYSDEKIERDVGKKESDTVRGKIMPKYLVSVRMGTMVI